ncbi:hypothetical protein M5K25_021097 [Dendrobium thyrsiflorum]|uniref:Uncharacterized protein n=1 Tax=Dendrobium thyrsiflorum TaxID=117978 RepID=A0ABD0UIY0_DENTH
MVGEWMMDPIKIPWFRHLGSSWSLVYLVRGGSRPNLTEGYLLAAMGFDAIGEHTGAGHNHNIVMSFGGESPVQRAPGHNRLSCGAIWRQNRRLEDSYHVLTGKRLFENGSYRNFGSLPASPPFRGKTKKPVFPSSPRGRFRCRLLWRTNGIRLGGEWRLASEELKVDSPVRSTNAPQQMWFTSRANHMKLPVIRPYLYVLDSAFYTHSGFKLEPWEICSPMLNLLKLEDLKSSFFGCGFRVYEYLVVARDSLSTGTLFSPIKYENFVDYKYLNLSSQVLLRASYRPYRRSVVVASGDSSVDSESPPRFTCSICDAMLGSDSSSSGKYRSSSELQSIGNTIIQDSGDASLTYSSFTGVLGTTEMTQHTSVGRKSVSPSSSVSPILSPDIKSVNLMGCLTVCLVFLLADFTLPEFKELAWLRDYLQLPFLVLLGSDNLRRQWSQPHVGVGALVGMWLPIAIIFAGRHNRLHYQYLCLTIYTTSILMVSLTSSSPSDLSYFPCLLPYFLPIIGSLSGGATGSPVLRLVGEFLRPADCGRMGEDLQEAKPDVTPMFFILSSFSSSCIFGFGLQLCFPFCRDLFGRIPELGVQVSHPDVHRVGLVVIFIPFHLGRSAARCTRWAGASVVLSLLSGLSEFLPFTGIAAILAAIAGKSTLPNWMVAPRMVGEWMMDPIKIPWFRHLGSSWSLVYLVRGDSRPNLTEGSLSAAMGFDAIGEHMDAGHSHNIMMSFGGESPGSEGPGRNFDSLPASPPFRGKTKKPVFPSSPRGRFRRRSEHEVQLDRVRGAGSKRQRA